MEREWYDDGFTMEEQAELRKNSVQIKVKLTEKFKAESADKLIKKLQTEIGVHKSYIDELQHEQRQYENKIKILEDQVTHWQSAFKKISDKYSTDMKELYHDPVIGNLKEENKNLQKEISNLKDIRDKLIYELNNERLSKSNQ